MNKSQRVVVGVVLILMGIVTFILAVSIGSYLSSPPPPHGFVLDRLIHKEILEFYPVILLGIAFTGGGIFVLISKKERR